MSSGVSSPPPSSSVPPPTAKRVILNSSTSDVRLECDAYRSPTRHQSDDDDDDETSSRKNVKHVFVCLHAHGKPGASRQMLKPHAIMLARGGFIAYNEFRGCDGNKETSSASLIGDVDRDGWRLCETFETAKEAKT